MQQVLCAMASQRHSLFVGRGTKYTSFCCSYHRLASWVLEKSSPMCLSSHFCFILPETGPPMGGGRSQSWVWEHRFLLLPRPMFPRFLADSTPWLCFLLQGIRWCLSYSLVPPLLTRFSPGQNEAEIAPASQWGSNEITLSCWYKAHLLIKELSDQLPKLNGPCLHLV